jgi:hypothetical protein
VLENLLAGHPMDNTKGGESGGCGIIKGEKSDRPPLEMDAATFNRLKP